MKILIDMNLSPEWVRILTTAGIESVHWSTIGSPSAPDREIMNWALDNSYIVFTNDLDFGTLLAITQANSPSVIQVRTQDLLPDAVGELLINTLQEFESQLEAGALLTIDQMRSRIRILPIGN
jgi:predicted nuclease of predicted toxin-antitoxin system